MENYILTQRASWGLKPRRQSLSLLWGLLQEAKEESGYVGCFAKKKKSRYSECQKLLLIKENQTSKVHDFTTFLCTRKCEYLLKYLVSLYPESPQRAQAGSGGGGVSCFDGWLLEGSSILWYGRGHFLSTKRWGGSKMTIHRAAKELPPQADNAGTQSWTSSLQGYEKMNVCYLSLPDSGILWWQPELAEMVSTLITKLWAPWR